MAQPDKLILKISDLKKAYPLAGGGTRPVLDIDSFAMEPAQEVALAGSSGAGKSTLLNVITGITRADSGSISIGGFDITKASEAQRDHFRAQNIGLIYQSFNLLQSMTALENVLLAMGFGGGRNEAKAKELLTRVGLAERLHDRPSSLSVGQQQRVAVARALANRPQLIVADEPTGSLDPENAQEVLKLIREIAQEFGSALLLVSHDKSVLAQIPKVVDLRSLNKAAA